MRLLELRGQLKYTPTNQSRDQYTDWLRARHKIPVLGAGGSARVFAHPTDKNTAVKVFYTADDSYMKYMKWCLRNQNNPWVPKIHDVKYFTKGQPGSVLKDDYGIVFMEKLTPLSPNAYGQFLQDMGLNWFEFDNGQRPALKRVIERLRNNNDIIERDSLIELLSYLYRNFKLYDFHKGNFMLRGNQVVFADPVGPQS